MRVVLCSTSPWSPSFAREHAVAHSAAADGHTVVFVERALDVRALLTVHSRREWLRRIRPRIVAVEPRIDVAGYSTLVPGHRSRLAQILDANRLTATLSHVPGIDGALAVATRPWQWPALAAVPVARRVFDCTDDWRSLMSPRLRKADSLFRRIVREADVVILASSDLVEDFDGARIAIVGNGASAVLLEAPLPPPTEDRIMVYTGTLSERFDASFLLAVLDHLRGWSAELYGACQYRGRGRAPGPELQAVIDASRGRIELHDPVDRNELATALDRGRVLIAPHRSSFTRGQDSMKLYDYATRGRPIVCTPGALGDADHIAGAGVIEAATPSAFADAVLAAGDEDPAVVARRRQWAQRHSWASRWLAWAEAAFGTAPPGEDQG